MLLRPVTPRMAQRRVWHRRGAFQPGVVRAILEPHHHRMGRRGATPSLWRWHRRRQRVVSGLQMIIVASKARRSRMPKNERIAIREYDAVTPITITNSWARSGDLDRAAEMDGRRDNYPGMDICRASPPCADLMQVSRQQPFMLMSRLNQQNWVPVSARSSAPVKCEKLSWQAVAHGADTVQFFQMKQSTAAANARRGHRARCAPKIPACSRRRGAGFDELTRTQAGSWVPEIAQSRHHVRLAELLVARRLRWSPAS